MGLEVKDPRSLDSTSHCPYTPSMFSWAFCAALAFMGGLTGGIISGWQLCRGLALAHEVQDGDIPYTRITLDPGRFPWSGAKTKLLSPDLTESETP